MTAIIERASGSLVPGLLLLLCPIADAWSLQKTNAFACQSTIAHTKMRLKSRDHETLEPSVRNLRSLDGLERACEDRSEMLS